MHKILIATDTWHPQVNGVVRTLDTTIQVLRGRGHAVRLIEPGLFSSCACPIYPELRMAWPAGRHVAALIDDFAPDMIHLANEGAVGLAVRRYCLARCLRFTTAYHTRTPEYLQRLIRFPAWLSYAYLKWFHRPSAAVMVATASVEGELRRWGFTGPLVRWSRGVNLDLFHPRPRTGAGPRPVLLYVGRVSREKNLEEFLKLRTPGVKHVVGDGPVRRALQAKYPEAVFRGALHGEELARAYAEADLFVFPSKTDTFGLVLLEALACGVPVAAHPAPGPLDILTDPHAGALDADLGAAVAAAFRQGDPRACVALARL